MRSVVYIKAPVVYKYSNTSNIIIPLIKVIENKMEM